jgi:hypothetical protein
MQWFGYNRDEKGSVLCQLDLRSGAHESRFADAIAQFGRGVAVEKHHCAVVLLLIEYLGCDENTLAGADAGLWLHLYMHAKSSTSVAESFRSFVASSDG